MREPTLEMTEVGHYLQGLMDERGIESRQELAERTGLSQSAVQKIFVREQYMLPQTAESLARELRCDPHQILRRTKPAKRVKGKASEFGRISYQPCWRCINAVADGVHGCPWSERLEPVPGWEAEESNRYDFKTYRIISCPMYEQDPPLWEEKK